MLQILKRKSPRYLQGVRSSSEKLLTPSPDVPVCNRCEKQPAAFFTEIGQGLIVRMCWACRWLPRTVQITRWIEAEWVPIH